MTSRKRKVGKYPEDFYFVDTGIDEYLGRVERSSIDKKLKTNVLLNQMTSPLKSSSSSANPPDRRIENSSIARKMV